jgi:hypothetical protein
LVLSRSAWGEEKEIFNPLLLARDAIELVYVERDGEVVSGLATNQSGDSVGISNAFGQPDDILDCVELVAQRHPMKGIVGYGSEYEVEALLEFGFQEIGDLRIWLRR